MEYNTLFKDRDICMCEMLQMLQKYFVTNHVGLGWVRLGSVGFGCV